VPVAASAGAAAASAEPVAAAVCPVVPDVPPPGAAPPVGVVDGVELGAELGVDEGVEEGVDEGVDEGVLVGAGVAPAAGQPWLMVSTQSPLPVVATSNDTEAVVDAVVGVEKGVNMCHSFPMLEPVYFVPFMVNSGVPLTEPPSIVKIQSIVPAGVSVPGPH
jgi:hypothetical protein